MSAEHILIVDDDPEVRGVVSRVLEDAGFEVSSVGRGDGVATRIKNGGVDLAIIDLGLPDADGLDLTRSLKEHSDVGIIIISGRGETTERIIGLEVGADDYLGKPFEPRELLARVRSVLRRTGPGSPENTGLEDVYRFHGWSLDVTRRKLVSDRHGETELSSGEFALLQAFVEHPNRVLSRDLLIDLTHGADSPAFDRSVDVQVGRLRKKIEDNPRRPQLIKTVRNGGYMFAAKLSRG